MRSGAILWGILCLALCVQCTSIQRATRVEIVLDAEPSLRERITRVDLAFYTSIKRDAWRMRGQERLRTEGGGAWPLQASFARAHAEDQRFSVEARALDADDKTIAELRAVGDFRDQNNVKLTLSFDASCAEVCGEGRTCRDSACVDAQVTPNMIASMSDASGTGRDAEANPSDPTNTALTSCADAGGCVNECGRDHGGCDPAVSCKLEQGKPRCGACPSGFEPQSDGSCSALLRGLSVEGAALDPAFRPDHTEYTLITGLMAGPWVLTPTAAAGAQLSLNGAPLAADAPVTPQLIAADAAQLTITVAGPHGQGRAYHFMLQARGEQLQILKAPTPTTDARFGNRFVLDGDTLVVAAEGDSSSGRGINPSDPAPDGAANSGAVYIYRRRGASWELEAYVKASDASADAAFGWSLALHGNTLVVGALRDRGRGAAYVYERSGDSWKEQIKLVPDEQTGQDFGQAVTVLGDLLVVAAPSYDLQGTDAGLIFVYKKQTADNTWVLDKTIAAQEPMALAWFGSSVRLSAEFLLVGATGEANGSVASGTAYVLRADTFEVADTLRPSMPSATAFFGERIAISGDTIAVSMFNNNAGFGNGLVYIFTRTPDGKFEQTTVLQASNASGGDMFGTGLALSEGYLLVGAAGENTGARGINGSLTAQSLQNSGAVYLFARSAAGFTQIAHIKASEPAPGAQLGYDVAISGADIVVSADRDPRAATGSGAVYVFR